MTTSETLASPPLLLAVVRPASTWLDRIWSGKIIISSELTDKLLKMGKVQADFTAMTNLYRKQQSLLKTALGHGGG